MHNDNGQADLAQIANKMFKMLGRYHVRQNSNGNLLPNLSALLKILIDRSHLLELAANEFHNCQTDWNLELSCQEIIGLSFNITSNTTQPPFHLTVSVRPELYDPHADLFFSNEVFDLHLHYYAQNRLKHGVALEISRNDVELNISPGFTQLAILLHNLPEFRNLLDLLPVGQRQMLKKHLLALA